MPHGKRKKELQKCYMVSNTRYRTSFFDVSYLVGCEAMGSGGRGSELAWRALGMGGRAGLPAGRALKPAGMVPKPAERAPEPAGRAQEPPERVLE
jgi:hypothetical protein